MDLFITNHVEISVSHGTISIHLFKMVNN